MTQNGEVSATLRRCRLLVEPPTPAASFLVAENEQQMNHVFYIRTFTNGSQFAEPVWGFVDAVIGSTTRLRETSWDAPVCLRRECPEN